MPRLPGSLRLWGSILLGLGSEDNTTRVAPQSGTDPLLQRAKFLEWVVRTSGDVCTQLSITDNEDDFNLPLRTEKHTTLYLCLLSPNLDQNFSLISPHLPILPALGLNEEPESCKFTD